MQGQRIILELGGGAALHGGDYTKAAVRAVNDAIHHSSLSFVRAMDIAPSELRVDVTIGVQQPGSVDAEAVKAALPHGKVAVKVVHGGLDVPDTDSGDLTVIASAAIAVSVSRD